MTDSDDIAVAVQKVSRPAAIKMIRMWHWAQAQQLHHLMMNPNTPDKDKRKFELRGIMHLRFVDALDALFPGKSVMDDLAAEQKRNERRKGRR